MLTEKRAGKELPLLFYNVHGTAFALHIIFGHIPAQNGKEQELDTIEEQDQADDSGPSVDCISEKKWCRWP